MRVANRNPGVQLEDDATTGVRTLSWFEKRANGPWERKSRTFGEGEDEELRKMLYKLKMKLLAAG